MAILKTTSLGEIRGRNDDGVVQYLGIKYASLKDRLADAELVESREGDIILDATKDGPTPVSPSFGCDLELSAIQHPLPKKELHQSDVDCLNLNIAVPPGTTASSKLPVLLFIYGGGFMIGANSWPQYDYARLIRLSAEKNLPIVGVSINYRLGPFGFLTSDELRKSGYKANNGLRDQRVAMEWVQRHIRGFGGDPDNVTVAGESAGAASVIYHLHSERQQFKRAVAMSGSLFPKPLPYSEHEDNYQQVMAALGLANAAAEERVRVLLETPGQDLIANLPPSIPSLPAVDGDMILSTVTFAEAGEKDSEVPKGKTSRKDLMVGDTQMDASIIALLLSHMQKGCAKRFTDVIYDVLPSQPAVAQQILDKYGITANSPDEEAFPAILKYINDIVFFAPTVKLAKGWRGNAYVYHFNEGNPWDGPWKDRASHILDVAYLFQNFREFLSPAQQAVGIAFAEDIFNYCHGIAPWGEVPPGETTDFTARTYGPSSQNRTVEQVSEPYGEQSMRRSTIFDYADQVSLDDLLSVFVEFQMRS